MVPYSFSGKREQAASGPKCASTESYIKRHTGTGAFFKYVDLMQKTKGVGGKLFKYAKKKQGWGLER